MTVIELSDEEDGFLNNAIESYRWEALENETIPEDADQHERDVHTRELALYEEVSNKLKKR